MRHRERGVTFLGWVVLLLPVALIVYAGIRLTPVYLEYMKIARSLEQVAAKRGVTMNTVRSQLKQVFSKTDTNRQGELVHLVLAGIASIREREAM